MEEYALNRLERVFQDFCPEPNDQKGLYAIRSRNIVNALKRKHPYVHSFKNAFWKILYNLTLNRPACQYNLEQLFDGRWETAKSFIEATDDDLDPVKAKFRSDVRNRDIIRKQNSLKLLSDVGLICPLCKSNDTEYTFLQTSKGDEGSTARVLCNTCEYRWKFR
jgi:DNA-directed RNA polymerase subunit M/transcription elongation factor TFIIS